MATEISWFDSTAQDYHYIYTRSVVAHTVTGSSCIFQSANVLPRGANGIDYSNRLP